ncbi:toxin-antitoxin system YwqK family antitoxin [Zunongwangia sp.]|uniref:toxin-antitoxin system YwqK family antitoxin n=1 Tax=Zunongwangia sp. TaxID=1965325 RepID=UPI003AA7B024
MKKLIILLFICISFTKVCAQNINQKDNEGKRDGLWIVNYPNTNQIKFEGTFKHGKEVGKFKFYKKGITENPSAIMNFETGSDSVKITYYSQKSEIISEGMMLNKKRAGKWITYHNGTDQVMQKEFYKNDKLEGTQTTYYRDGKKAEVTEYRNGLKNGKSQIFSTEGQLLQKLNYKDGQIHGHVTFYNADGDFVAEGDYANGERIKDRDSKNQPKNN